MTSSIKLLFRSLLSILAPALISLTVHAQDSLPKWMRYPAISPDGLTIVFSYKGDLYTVPSSGGKASVLTLHEAHDFKPVWSPDSKQIAFASDRYGNYDIFVIPAEGGSPKRLTWHSANDYPSDFSPDGKRVLFESRRTDAASNAQFPYGYLPELYEVPVGGGRVKQVVTTPAIDAKYHKSGKMILYHDQKGYEDPWRKHHVSSVTRDIWVLDVDNKRHKQLTTYEGEDRNPAWAPNEQEIYYLSEKSGSFNVWKLTILDPSLTVQVSRFDKHPVRFLTMSSTGTLCYGYNGEIYTQKDGEEPRKINITVLNDGRAKERTFESVNGNITEMAVSPDGEEIAFISRGEVFVTSVKHKLTKRITNTPEMERDISFSPDGRSLLYASERKGSWNIYQTRLARSEEKYFYLSTVVTEEDVVVDTKEAFQPAWSPDGKEVAYLEERTTLKVFNLAARRSRTVMTGDHSYSYIDGDQYYQWSPDGKYFLVNFFDRNRWDNEVGLVNASGDGKVVNLTNSGYGDLNPKWVLGGKAMMWISDRYGAFQHSGRGSEDDIMAMYFTQEAFDRANLDATEWDILKKEEEKDKKTTSNEAVRIEMDGLDQRIKRLTPRASWLADAVLSDDGATIYFLSRSSDKGYDLWSHNIYKKESKTLTNVGGSGKLAISKDGKSIFVQADGKLYKVETADGKKTAVSFDAEMEVNAAAEMDYFLEHMWRQAYKKFYKEDMHGVDWEFYKKEYRKKLPYIANLRDFSELASEMLGELNASHTGAKYRVNKPDGSDETAALGVIYDESHTGDGWKIAEVIKQGPLDMATSKVRAGTIIEKIDGVTITANMNPYRLLNRKEGVYVLLSVYDPARSSRWDERVKAISLGTQNDLLYDRWVRSRESETERLSKGRIGYVHVKGMNDASFRTVYDKALGMYYDKEALIVDTRFNGGGNLHDQLCVFLNGKKYYSLLPRGQDLGIRPSTRWTKPSLVLMGEGNYSDAHLFPYAYKALEIGKLVGMPVPGTGTSVWWESLYIGLRFGIPEVGYLGNDGTFMENQELKPDTQVKNEYEKVATGEDQQLEKAVEELLKELGAKKK
ncbi:MAG: PD40 domain-containing protein [Flavobacteriales bacterium]|nr:PD40 domain-containing protein [Flavobacteriales bacterium]